MANPRNIQRLIISRYSQPQRVNLLFQINTAAPARRFLGTWLKQTPTGPSDTSPRAPILHFAFSWAGLARLLEDEGNLDIGEGRAQMGAFFTDPTQAPDGRAMADELSVGRVERSD